MATIIKIKERRQVEPDAWEVDLQESRRGKDSKRVCRIQNPYTIVDEENLSWYIERHSELDPFDEVRARTASQSLKEYGCRLVEMLELEQVLKDDCIIEIEGLAGGCLMKIHWEALEGYNQDTSNILVYRKVIPSTTSPELNIPKSNSFHNILMVSARPDGVNDLGHRLLSRPLLALTKGLEPEGTKVNLQLVQPGTWKALRDHLDEVASYPGKGKGFYDILHLDVHGVIEAGKPYLSFTSPKNMSTRYVSAEELFALLREHEIPTLITNACNSANSTGTTGSNLAECLVQAGIPQVLAMSYLCSGAAASTFVEAFYSTLFQNGVNFADAASIARFQLRSSKSRPARLATTVEVDDYIVPVVYSSIEYTFKLPSRNTSRQVSPTQKQANPASVGQKIWKWVSNATTFKNPKALHPKEDSILQGRDADILNIESMALSPSHSNTLLIHGSAGAGKSVLVKHLCWWWKETGLVRECFYTDFDAGYMQYTPWDMMASMGATRKSENDRPELSEVMLRVIHQERVLIVIDNLDAGTLATYAQRVKYGEEEKTDLKWFIEMLQGTKTILLLTSRSEEQWLGKDLVKRYRLGGLSPTIAHELTMKRLRVERREAFLQDKESREYLERLILSFDGNCAAMDLYMHDIRNGSLSSKVLYYKLQLGTASWIDAKGIFTNGPSRSSIRLLSTASDVVSRYSAAHPEHEFVLLSLAYLSSRFREDWFEYIFQHSAVLTKKSIPSNLVEFMATFRSMILDKGWIEEDLEFRPTRRHPYNYYRIHPVFTQVLRSRLANYKSIENPEAVVQHLTILSICDRMLKWDSYSSENFKKMRREFSAEFRNFISAIDIGLKKLIMSAMTDDSIATVTFFILMRLWAFTATKETDREPVLDRCRLFLLLYGVAEDNDAKEIVLQKPQLEHVVHISNCLSEYYLESAPARAAKFANASLQLIDGAYKDNVEPEVDMLGHKYQALMIRGISLISMGQYDEGKDVLSDLMTKRLGGEAHGKFLMAWIRLRCIYTLAYTTGVRDTVDVDALLKDAQLSYAEYASEGPKAGYGIVADPSMSFVNLLSDPNRIGDFNRMSRLPVQNADISNHGVISTMPEIAKVEILLAESRVENAKTHLLAVLASAMKRGDYPAQAVYYSKLIDIAIEQRAWKTATSYIDKFTALETKSSVSGGQWAVRTTPVELMERNCRWGICYIRLQEYDKAGPLLVRAFGNPGHSERIIEAAGLDQAFDSATNSPGLFGKAFGRGSKDFDEFSLFGILNLVTFNTPEGQARAQPHVDMKAYLQAIAQQEALIPFEKLSGTEQTELLCKPLGYEMGRGRLTLAEYFEILPGILQLSIRRQLEDRAARGGRFEEVGDDE